jgi:serine/threonine protein phosphatase PrpC
MELDFNENDKFIVVGSDGLYEYLSNEQVKFNNKLKVMNTVVPVYM